MRKSIVTIVCSLIVYGSMAQADMIQLLYQTNKFQEAKSEVDKALSNPKLKEKDKPVLTLWKMLINSELYASETLSANFPNANSDALAALKDYVSMDPTLKIFKEENFTRAVGLLYSLGFENGRNYFQKEDWDNSFKYFSQAAEMSDFIMSNGLGQGNATIDTTTILFTGYAAQNAKKSDEAVKYYTRISDLKIAGAEYKDPYRYLIDHYETIKDEANYNKYLSLAKELFPEEAELWGQVEMRHMLANGGLKNVIDVYKNDVAAGALTESKLISFAEAFADPDSADIAGFDSVQKVNIKLYAAEAFGKAFELNNTKGLYAFNSGVLYYNVFNLLDERYMQYRGDGAALKTKRDEVAKEQSVWADKSLAILEKAYNALKTNTNRSKSETISLNRCVDYLANIYQWKRDRSRGVNPKDYDAFDAKLKQYENEHGIY